MLISYKEQAEKYYKGHAKYEKALAAGIAMDNALKLEYTKGGTTRCHFMTDNYLAYFDVDALKRHKVW